MSNEEMKVLPGNQITEPADAIAGELPSMDNRQMMNLLENTKLLNNIVRIAKVYANSSMVPKQYQRSVDNCFVAVELAGRMGVSPVLVMQNLYVVQGRPSWSGQACVALINGCGKFSEELKFIFVGNESSDDYGCYAKTIRKADGEELCGTTITIKMAKDEGWHGKDGSKWKTMPRQMLMYRAAAFFARTYCPEVLMGFSTAEEVEDISLSDDKQIIRV